MDILHGNKGKWQVTIRALRILRIATSVKRLRIIIVAIIETLPSMGWVSLLLFILYYIFAIIGTNMFGADFNKWFGTLGRSMYTLFQVMTLESWSMGISRPVMEVFPYAFLYFVPFIVISAFIVVNVVVGIVVNAISEIAAAEAKDQEEMAGSAGSKNVELKAELVKLKAQIENLEKLL
ncbi:ion transporter [Desulfosporosinus sp. BICA1-9]|uniref:ion transporter n=1 Tax=Desulfosporosinus sp. BICA1-9 TaxID=1531958 RepID=UPI000B16F8FF|nr:ion transporter [Desulfosporosinus sp. BICA1-9]HBW38511.1 hypothetical protein [Desulfosporosinus sp.]